MFVESPNVKGAVAELAIELAATKLGIPVLKPVAEHGRYDMGFEIGMRILRVQVKSAGLVRNGTALVIKTETARRTADGYLRTKYARGEIDLLAAYAHDLDECYLLPAELACDRRALQLRLEPPKNGQRAGINLASDYEFDGAVAQLARAPAWHAGGRGFESPQLHSPPQNSGAVVVEANEFRNRFGWYMERAAAGEEFHVERRGRPFVRLTGAASQLRLEGVPTLKQASRGLFVGRHAAAKAAA
jgi:prevent-host-death family protein